ncbi:MAG: hypothetical protein H8E66_19375 [Planctomycetes bacterium]|nr:hypothetical protein [Planctomycetota bacterium]
MPYYMTFFVDHPDKVAFADIETGLKREDHNYHIDVLDRDVLDHFDTSNLYYGDEAYARIEINRPKEALFRSEIQERVEAVQDGGEGQTSRVIKILRQTNTIVRVHVLWQNRATELTLSSLQPLWDWLFLFRSGVLHADGEGFYDEEGMIVETR